MLLHGAQWWQGDGQLLIKENSFCWYNAFPWQFYRNIKWSNAFILKYPCWCSKMFKGHKHHVTFITTNLWKIIFACLFTLTEQCTNFIILYKNSKHQYDNNNLFTEVISAQNYNEISLIKFLHWYCHYHWFHLCSCRHLFVQLHWKWGECLSHSCWSRTHPNHQRIQPYCLSGS